MHAIAARRDEVDRLTERIIGAAISVHRELGPGLLESVYEACLAYELERAGLKVERQKPLPVRYRDVTLDCGYRADLLVDESVIVEIKAAEKVEPVHKAQVLSYLKMSGCRMGLRINFNVKMVKDGVHRVVNQLPESDRAS